MSPLMLMILLHYRGHATDFKDGDFSAPAVREAIGYFVEEGMLTKNDRTAYKLTDKGCFFVDYLCQIPLPVTRFEIPLPGMESKGMREENTERDQSY